MCVARPLKIWKTFVLDSPFNPLTANHTKWSNILKQFADKHHFVKLVLKGLNEVTDLQRETLSKKILRHRYSVVTFCEHLPHRTQAYLGLSRTSLLELFRK